MSDTPFSVVLTGGIGSGKSAVSDRFQALGAEIIDTDVLARDLVAPGQPALAAIVERFGNDLLLPDGQLNRTGLRERIFQNKEERLWLEGLLHPLIQQEAETRAKASEAAYIIVVIPLFTESNRYSFIDRVLVVDVDPDTQIQRVKKRDKNNDALVKKILSSQLDRDTRLALADDVIKNEAGLDALDTKVRALHEKYLLLADKAHKQHS